MEIIYESFWNFSDVLGYVEIAENQVLEA